VPTRCRSFDDESVDWTRRALEEDLRQRDRGDDGKEIRHSERFGEKVRPDLGRVEADAHVGGLVAGDSDRQ